jgi:MerR family transcriptional regulator, light-induced transcriptional regulator
VIALSTLQAARVLNVSVNTLYHWERRYGFPTSAAPPGERRRFSHIDVVALRDALNDELSVPAAIAHAQVAVAEHRNMQALALAGLDRPGPSVSGSR